MLDDICAIYGHGDGAASARSITLDDINKITGVTLTETTFSPETPSGEKINENSLYGEDYSFTNQYTPESYRAGQTTSGSGKSQWYNYLINREGLQTNTTTNPTNGSTLYNLICTGNNYWIATRGTGKISGNTIIGYALAFAERTESWTLVTNVFI